MVPETDKPAKQRNGFQSTKTYKQVSDHHRDTGIGSQPDSFQWFHNTIFISVVHIAIAIQYQRI
jgi:hypothetical protein